jgi:peptidoglycan/LPS O-acetylase OafA/YrhL
MKNNFDGLRLIGALMVLVDHQFALQGYAEPKLFGVLLGWVGLAIFFGISGYLVTGSWLNDPNVFRFFAKRFLRLWPALAVTVAVIWCFCHWLPWYGIDAFKYPLAGNLYLGNLLLFERRDWNGFFPTLHWGVVNGSLWTIQIEVRCYAALGLALFLLGRHARWLVIPSMMLAGAMFPDWVALLGGCFLAGVALRFWGPWTVIPAVVLVAALGHWTAAIMLCLAAGAVVVGRQDWAAMRSAGARGDFSYGIYLWAWPVGQIGVLLFQPSPWLIFWTLSATSVLAWLSWHLIESQALKLKPSGSGTGARWYHQTSNREEAQGMAGSTQLVRPAVE